MKIGKNKIRKKTRKQKLVIRIKWKNSRFRTLHPEKTVPLAEEYKGDYFPPEILAIKHPFKKQEAMKSYMELHHGLRLQKKYRHSCQSEMNLLKLSRNLGLAPSEDPAQKREFRRWAKQMKAIKLEKLKKKQERKNKRRKVKKHLPYTALLALQAKEMGFEGIKYTGRKVRKHARVKYSRGDSKYRPNWSRNTWTKAVR
jgi:hypothetical protein